jgi:hypothetical protein
MPIGRMLVIVFLLLSILLVSHSTSLTQIAEEPTLSAASLIPYAVEATQTGSSSTGDTVGLILGNFLILCLYSFPMSYAENWAFAVPKKVSQHPKKESPELDVDTGKPSDEASASADEWTKLSKRLPQWTHKYPRAWVGLATGGCLMVTVVIIGAAAFALYYLFRDQPEKVSQIVPRFAYWFPFALLGMVTDVPFTARMFDLENRRKKVLVRLVVWWFPRFIIFVFMFNLPIVRDLDPATSALIVLAIDAILTAFFLGLHNFRKQVGMKTV